MCGVKVRAGRVLEEEKFIFLMRQRGWENNEHLNVSFKGDLVDLIDCHIGRRGIEHTELRWRDRGDVCLSSVDQGPLEEKRTPFCFETAG